MGVLWSNDRPPAALEQTTNGSGEEAMRSGILKGENRILPMNGVFLVGARTSLM